MAVSSSLVLLKSFFFMELLIFWGIEICPVYALTVNYYGLSCPLAETMVRNIVNTALLTDSTLSAPLLRMHFHDCFVEGCDGSVLIDSTKGNVAEKESPANILLRGYEVIDQAKQAIEHQCPGMVSCADILAMVARDAVLWAGGPYYDVPTGRKDGRRSKIEDTINLPPPTFNSSDLIKTFTKRGLTVQDMVALSGGHTLGVARCASFKNRLKNFDSKNDVDPSLDRTYAQLLAQTCSGSGGDNTTSPFDFTSTSFDNQYYRAIQASGGLLTSDQTLYTDPSTRGMIDGYAVNLPLFFYDFSQAMIKMGQLGVKEGGQGEIRLNCRKIN